MFHIKKKEDKEPDNKNVRLIVTGQCGDVCKEQLKKDLKEKGVKAVVTSSPVLGVFDL